MCPCFASCRPPVAPWSVSPSGRQTGPLWSPGLSWTGRTSWRTGWWGPQRCRSRWPRWTSQSSRPRRRRSRWWSSSWTAGSARHDQWPFKTYAKIACSGGGGKQFRWDADFGSKRVLSLAQRKNCCLDRLATNSRKSPRKGTRTDSWVKQTSIVHWQYQALTKVCSGTFTATARWKLLKPWWFILKSKQMMT